MDLLSVACIIDTSGAGSRASAEQFVGSYNYVGFILVLVGLKFETVSETRLKMACEGSRSRVK